jgi:hypothetical protein
MLICSQQVWAQEAASDSGEVAVNGVVAPLCILGAPSPAVVDLGQLVNTSGPRVGRIAAIADRQVSLANSFCNFAGSAVSVEVTALQLTQNVALQSGFAQVVNYSASVGNWAASPTTARSAASASGATPTQTSSGAVQNLPRIADISVTLSDFVVPADSLLVSGTYQGAVVITLGPAASIGAN